MRKIITALVIACTSAPALAMGSSVGFTFTPVWVYLSNVWVQYWM